MNSRINPFLAYLSAAMLAVVWLLCLHTMIRENFF